MADSWVHKSGLNYFKQKFSSEVDNKLKELAAVSLLSSGSKYRVLSDGRIVQWGRLLVANGTGTKLVFPVSFSTAIESVICEPIGDVTVSHSVTTDNLGTATVKHNGNGGVEFFFYAVGS